MLPRKYRIHAFLAILALVIIFYPSYMKQPDQQVLDASNAAANAFLRLIDSGKYQESWQSCSPYLQTKVPLTKWLDELGAVRDTAGKLLERRQVDHTYSKEAHKKGIPAGDYMVYTYSTTFVNKKDAQETVTLMLGQDGIWRVAGYFIK